MKVIAIIVLVLGSLALLSGLGGSVVLFMNEQLRAQAEHLWIAALLQVTLSLFLIVGASAVLVSSFRLLRLMRVALPVLLALVLIDSLINFDGAMNLPFFVSVFVFQVIPATALWVIARKRLKSNTRDLDRLRDRHEN
ncbi:MAG: hypothetical protein V2J10_10355 [Wenzhouxiangella sp.]|jgi:hypothetical protein|nr:hypothetical protein [Wenzhouxiangella sp.]